VKEQQKMNEHIENIILIDIELIKNEIKLGMIFLEN
jgi:hypothetical protein